MTSMLPPIPQPPPACGYRNQMVPAGTGQLAELNLMRVAAEIGVEGERDEVLLNVFGINLCSGEPPGAIRGTGASRSPQG